ncbi:MAG: hypothetical protein JWQ29_1687 [Phenylobacterium sp.]|nr:hypothetical protein [Phenylobacterium sp.]
MRKLIAPAALFAGLVLGTAALAAPAPNSSSSVSGLTVSPPVAQREVVGRSPIGAPIDSLSLSQAVSYADLNLANPADAKTLDHRVDRAALTACRELNSQYPQAFYPSISGNDCVADAEHQANTSVHAIEAGAEAQ